MADTTACRILVLSSTLDHAQQFVQRVKSVASDLGGSPDAPSQTNASDVASTNIPWTIVNKYYTADVHFETRELGEFMGNHAVDVPAVIYVWDSFEPYKEHIPTLAKKLQHSDPEVSLAVRFTSIAAAVARDDEEGLDEFMSEHGFEYVNGDRSGPQPPWVGASFDDEDSAGVPGLPRVVDALSTIMWPSLVQTASTSARRSRARELLDLAHEEEADDGLRALISSGSSHDAPEEGGQRKSRMQREMEELQRWLDDEDVGRRRMDDAQAWTARDDPFSFASTSTSARALDGDAPTPTIRTPDEAGFGFEDDFAEFVGAPMDVTYAYEAVRQEPTHTGASYHTLASVSDFADLDLDLDDDPDGDLPSRAEIEETSRRIFAGSASLDVPSTTSPRALRRSPQSQSLPLPPPTTTTSPTTSPQQNQTQQTTFHPLEDDAFGSFTDSEGGDDDDEEFELGAFDLSRVLSALQGMKEEIAGMTNEDERRKAAARVALGLVYGLRREDERERGEVGEL